MQYRNLLVLIALLSVAAAMPRLNKRTLDPATTNTQGKAPSTLACDAAKVLKAIQAAECAYNTRTSDTQTFAVFVQDHQYDGNNGYPYGTCSAYTCTAPTGDEMEADEDSWTFFWNDNGEDSGVGTDCIKDPSTGECGCENSDGSFVAGSDSCT